MTRLMIAAILLTAAVAPAFACDLQKSVSTEHEEPHCCVTDPGTQQAPVPAAHNDCP